jgi:hypothetical protein
VDAAFLSLSQYLFTEDRNLRGRTDTEANSVQPDLADDDLNVIADANAFGFLAR